MDKSLLFIFLRFFLLFLEVFLLETMFFKNENKRRFFLLRWIGAFFIMSGILILVSLLTLMIYVSASYERQIVMITSLIGYFLVLACQLPLLLFLYRTEKKRLFTLMIFSFVFRQIVFSLYVSIFTSINTNLLLFKFDFFTWQNFLLYLAFYFVLYLGVFLFCRFQPSYFSYSMETSIIIVLFVAIAANMVVCVIGETYSTDNNDFMYCLLLFSNIISLLLIISVEFLMRKIYDLRNENQITNQLLAEKESQYKFAKANMERLHIIAHDLKHESAILRRGGEEAKKILDDLLKDADEFKKMGITFEEKAFYDILKAILDNLDKGIENYDSILLTENQTLNVILNEKWLYCQKHAIRLSTIVDPTAFSRLSTIELYSLFGNLLDNSVEAVMKIKDKSKRAISLNVSHSHGISSIDIRNYFTGFIQIEEGLPQTTKKDSNNHGFGTKSIETTVNKYGGDYSCYIENDVFVVKIAIPDEC